MFRGGPMNPGVMGHPYGGSPYLHPQLRYHGGPMDIPGAPGVPPPQAPVPPPPGDPKMLQSGAPPPRKALDLLHQVSQHYSAHKIHELGDRAIISPTSAPGVPGPRSTVSPPPNQTSTSLGSTPGKALPNSSDSPSATAPGKGDTSPANPSGRRSTSPQRLFVHTHHHTHLITFPFTQSGYV